MKDSLITFFCGKNSSKKRKVLTILENISYNSETKEYLVPSATNPDKKYNVIYSSKAFEWKCDCQYSTYKKYIRYESVESRLKHFRTSNCVHIIASLIYKTLGDP